MVMFDKKYKGAPFGVQTSRFDVSGVHPQNKLPGTFTELPYDRKFMDDVTRSVGPGKYYANDGGFSDRAVKARSAGPGWARAYEVEKMAALPHLLFKDEWEARRALVKKMGPGKYETPVNELTGYLKKFPTRGVCDTLAERFTEIQKDAIPGPGTYGRGGVPDTEYQDRQKEATSTIGMMESGGPAGFNAGKNNKVPGPGSYKFTSFTDKHAIDQKAVAPFEMYSYDRNKPIITGHLALLKNANLAPGQYEIHSSIDEWKHKNKKKHGKFSTLTRFPTWPSDRHSLNTISQCHPGKNHPGPGSYNPQFFIEEDKSPHAPAFLISSQRKSLVKPGNTVGAGRYDIQKWDDLKPRNGHTNVFKSGCDNRPVNSKHKCIRERLRSTNVQGAKFSMPSGIHGYYSNLTRKCLM